MQPERLSVGAEKSGRSSRSQRRALDGRFRLSENDRVRTAEQLLGARTPVASVDETAQRRVTRIRMPVEELHSDSVPAQTPRQSDRGAFTKIRDAWLEPQPGDSDRPSPPGEDLSPNALEMRPVARSQGFQERSVDIDSPRQTAQSSHVPRQTRSAKRHSGLQVCPGGVELSVAAQRPQNRFAVEVQ